MISSVFILSFTISLLKTRYFGKLSKTHMGRIHPRTFLRANLKLAALKFCVVQLLVNRFNPRIWRKCHYLRMDQVIERVYLCAQGAQTVYLVFQEFALARFPYGLQIILGMLTVFYSVVYTKMINLTLILY